LSSARALTYLRNLSEEFEIGRILHLKSRNPKPQIELAWSEPIKQASRAKRSNLQFRISGFEMREAQARLRAASREDSSDFRSSPVSQQLDYSNILMPSARRGIRE